MKTNYHTHTNFCDGKDSIEDIINTAIEKNFDILGFSGHSMLPFADTWHIAPDRHKNYIHEVRKMADLYKDKITVLCGFEADYIRSITSPSIETLYYSLKPDYLIGSVHYIVTDKGYFCADDSADGVKEGIKKIFSGNAKKAVQEYFYLQREMLSKCNFTILGHPDLIRKQNAKLKMFTEKETWYIKELKAVAKAAAKSGVIAEINTGAIARKSMDDLYPSKDFLKILYEYKVPITINSDTHNKEFLDCAFDRAIEAAKKAGYTECAYLDADCNLKFQKI